MAGRGMGIATKGGGAVESGPRNKMLSETSKTTGPVMMAKGGEAKKKPKGMMAGGMMAKGMKAGGVAAKGMMAGGMMNDRMMPDGMEKGGEAKKKPKGMMAGGMMSKGYAAGGAAMKKKGFARGGKVS